MGIVSLAGSARERPCRPPRAAGFAGPEHAGGSTRRHPGPEQAHIHLPDGTRNGLTEDPIRFGFLSSNGSDATMSGSDRIIRIGLRRLVAPEGARRPLPRRGLASRAIRRSLPCRRDQFLVLQAAPPGDLCPLGRVRPGRLPVRRQGPEGGDPRAPPGGRGRRARPFPRRSDPARRQARAVARPAPAEPGILRHARGWASSPRSGTGFDGDVAFEPRHASWFAPAADRL